MCSYDPLGDFASKCNQDVAGDLLPMEEKTDIEMLRSLLEKHVMYTSSVLGSSILNDFDNQLVRLHLLL